VRDQTENDRLDCHRTDMPSRCPHRRLPL